MLALTPAERLRVQFVGSAPPQSQCLLADIKVKVRDTSITTVPYGRHSVTPGWLKAVERKKQTKKTTSLWALTLKKYITSMLQYPKRPQGGQSIH